MFSFAALVSVKLHWFKYANINISNVKVVNFMLYIFATVKNKQKEMLKKKIVYSGTIGTRKS